MDSQITVVFKNLPTGRADVGPLSRVLPHVNRQVAADGEAFPTGAADVRLLAGVGSSDVNGQIAGLDEVFATGGADIGLLARVLPPVPPESRHVLEAFPAGLTDVRFLRAVRRYVDRQLVAISEG